MKKLLAAFLMVCCGSTFAAFQYTVNQYPNTQSGNAISGAAYTVKVDAGSGSLYVVDKISSLYGGNNELFNSFVDVSSNQNYGWVNYSTGEWGYADGSSKVLYSARVNAYNPVVTQTAYKIGDFSVGDEVGVWLISKTSGNSGSSVFDRSYVLNSAAESYREFGGTSDAFENPLAQISLSGERSIFFGLYGEGIPNGQPLPGVALTLLLGGAVAVGMKKLRRKTA